MVTRIDRQRVHELIDEGAQVIEALPERFYKEEHIPGAVSIPLTKLNTETVRALNPDKPTITYCANEQCDLGPRAAARLETLGFSEVYEYSAGKDDWLSAGGDSEGTKSDEPTAIDAAKDVPVSRLNDDISIVKELVQHSGVVAVVNDDGVVMGQLNGSASSAGADDTIESIMEDGPVTVRPSERIEDVVDRMNTNKVETLLVTDPKGYLLGIVHKEDAEALLKAEGEEEDEANLVGSGSANGRR